MTYAAFTLPADSGAACKGKWFLFDSVFKADHEEARALCKACPVALGCKNLLADVAATSIAGAGPSGTWAGRLIHDRARGGKKKAGAA